MMTYNMKVKVRKRGMLQNKYNLKSGGKQGLP